MKSKYPQLEGLKGIEYRKAWNKLHRDKTRLAQREFRVRHPDIYKKRHHQHMLKHGMAETSRANIPFREKATQSYQRWVLRDDEMVMSGQLTIKQCALRLGRSLRAVMNRRHKLTHNLIQKHELQQVA
jgi:hypothetical protein